MTTTSHLQILPDFYNSKKECLNKTYEKTPQTNSRYKNFTQTHFTAGDEEQFVDYMDCKNTYTSPKLYPLDNNLFQKEELEVWHKYHNVSSEDIINTFRYIFNKFKKGVYIKIVNNKLKVFLPFSKVYYTNEWSSNIKINPKYKTITNFLEHICILEGRKFNPSRVNKNIKEWFGNNSLVRYEYPLSEGEKTISLVKTMFEELCKKRNIPDISLFYNRRDFPLLTKNETEPYNHIWGTKNKTLVSHKYTKYIPILSASSSDRYADILLPTWDDWARLESFENRWYKNTCKSYDNNFSINWSDKKETAVFRGSTTGSGTTIENNKRLKAVYICNTDKENIKEKYLDAGIVKWNLRPRKFENNQYIESIDINNLPFKLSNFLSPEDQSSYKYILNIEGHVSAYRLSIELSMNSVVLLVDSEWKLWYSRFLKPYIHYVPVKSDLSDLFSQVKWCRKNDSKCEQIAKNAKKFYDKFLCKKGVLDYLQFTLIKLKDKLGHFLYNTESALNTMINYEYSMLKYTYPYNKNSQVCFNDLKKHSSNTYGFLKSFEWLVNNLIVNDKIVDELKYIGDIFNNKVSKVYHSKIYNYDVVVKSTTDPKKIKELIHETFIAINAINYISKVVPNFIYVFGMYKQKNNFSLVLQKIDGITLFEYLKGDSFKFGEFILIFLQLLLSLQLAINKYGFIHYDLTPWNIMLKKTKNQTSINYILDYENMFHVDTNLYPVIIDLGKSHIIKDDIHHGYVKIFKMSSCQDYLTLLLNSIELIITKQNLNSSDLKHLFILINFITKNEYRRNKFETILDIKTFCRTNKKYSNLLDDPKFELEDTSPLDYIKYILKYFQEYNLPITKISKIIHPHSINNPLLIYHSFYTNNETEKVKIYIEIYDKIISNLPQEQNNLILNYYILNTILDNLCHIYDKISEIHNVSHNHYSFEEKHNYYCSIVKNKYLSSNSTDLNIKQILSCKNQKYSEETIMNPKKLLTILQDVPTLYNYNDYKDMLIYILSRNFEVSFPVKEIIAKYRNSILNLNSINHLRYIADNNTLKLLSYLVYSKNIQTLNSNKIENIYTAHLDIYEKILQIFNK